MTHAPPSPRLVRSWSPAVLVALVSVPLGGCGSGCSPSNPSNACEVVGQPRATLTGLDIGVVRYDPDRRVDEFVPFVDGGEAIITAGFQGSDMVAVTLAVTGSGFTDCVEQHTTIRRATGDVIWDEAAPQTARAQVGGVWWVGPALMIMDGVSSGTAANITATVQDRTVTRAVTLYGEGQAPPDARADAEPADAAVDAAVDAAADAALLVAP